MKLFGFFRSSAAYRCRLALGIKQLSFDFESVNFRRQEQASERFKAINPQGLVPALEVDGHVLTQSLAIIEWLEETHPEPPILPKDPLERAEVRAFALAIASDIHPINNLRVLERLRGELALEQEAVDSWYRHWVESGLRSCEALVRRAGRVGPYCFGSSPGLADVCLVPQMFNARRFKCDLSDVPTLVRIDKACAAHSAFAAALPELQPDAVA